MCACWLYAAFFPCLLLYSFEKLVTMATACVQCLCKGHPSCLHPPLRPKTLLLWDLTGQKQEMQIVLAELATIINPRLVSELLMGCADKQLNTLTKTATPNQLCERARASTTMGCHVV